MYMMGGLHQSGKEADVFADELSEAVDSGMGSITNICLVVNIVSTRSAGIYKQEKRPLVHTNK